MPRQIKGRQTLLLVHVFFEVNIAQRMQFELTNLIQSRTRWMRASRSLRRLGTKWSGISRRPSSQMVRRRHCAVTRTITGGRRAGIPTDPMGS
jgi:hypothetical protein